VQESVEEEEIAGRLLRGGRRRKALRTSRFSFAEQGILEALELSSFIFSSEEDCRKRETGEDLATTRRPTSRTRVAIVTAPGQEAQVDYGVGPILRDPESRKYWRNRLFVMTLNCSRKSVSLLTFRSSSRIWACPHQDTLALTAILLVFPAVSCVIPHRTGCPPSALLRQLGGNGRVPRDLQAASS
jgi:hypothetical protein